MRCSIPIGKRGPVKVGGLFGLKRGKYVLLTVAGWTAAYVEFDTVLMRGEDGIGSYHIAPSWCHLRH